MEAMSGEGWIPVCDAADVPCNGVHRFDHGARSFAIYNLGGRFFATDGHCTHEQQHLEEGTVTDGIIECPLHLGQFDIETGEALAGPVCIDLETFEIRNESGRLYLRL